MKPKKRSVRKNGKKAWELDFGMDEEGHRRRFFFPTEDDLLLGAA